MDGWVTKCFKSPSPKKPAKASPTTPFPRRPLPHGNKFWSKDGPFWIFETSPCCKNNVCVVDVATFTLTTLWNTALYCPVLPARMSSLPSSTSSSIALYASVCVMWLVAVDRWIDSYFLKTQDRACCFGNFFSHDDFQCQMMLTTGCSTNATL